MMCLGMVRSSSSSALLNNPHISDNSFAASTLIAPKLPCTDYKLFFVPAFPSVELEGIKQI